MAESVESEERAKRLLKPKRRLFGTGEPGEDPLVQFWGSQKLGKVGLGVSLAATAGEIADVTSKVKDAVGGGSALKKVAPVVEGVETATRGGLRGVGALGKKVAPVDALLMVVEAASLVSPTVRRQAEKDLEDMSKLNAGGRILAGQADPMKTLYATGKALGKVFDAEADVVKSQRRLTAAKEVKNLADFRLTGVTDQAARIQIKLKTLQDTKGKSGMGVYRMLKKERGY